MSVVLKAKEAIKKHFLVGNTIFDDNEYEKLLVITRNLSKDFLVSSSYNILRREIEVIFITLLEITKRWKKIDDDENDESGFWEYIMKTIIGIEKKNSNYTKLYKGYTDVIDAVEVKHQIIFAKEGKIYYRTLMLHAIAPTKSLYAFLDLCYNIYKKDLNFNYTPDDKPFCELITIRFCEIIKKAVGNDKAISIGTNSYNVKVGLRTLAVQKENQNYFIDFLDEALKNINILFYDQNINTQSYFGMLIDSWWQEKQLEIGIDKKGRSQLTPAVTKNKISIKFIRFNDTVYLVIPPIRIENIEKSNFFLSITVDGSNLPLIAEELFTKRGEFIDTTKQKDIDLNNLLQDNKYIRFKIEITENQTILFKKIIEKEYILFENENEILSNIIPSNNYFIYIRDLTLLLDKPELIRLISANLFNIYPKIGECLTSKERQIFFQDISNDIKNLEKTQLIGALSNGIWIFDNKTYSIFNEKIFLLVPNNLQLKGLELRINQKKIFISEININDESVIKLEENYKLFQISEYIPNNIPVEIMLYSHLEEKVLFNMLIVYFTKLCIKFSNNIFYGEDEKYVTIIYNDNIEVLSWNNRQNELNYSLQNGELILYIPYIKWHIDNKEWKNEPYSNKLWYRDTFHIGSILEFESNYKVDKLLVEKGDQILNYILLNKDGKFDIGDCIYNTSNYIQNNKNASEFSLSFISFDNNIKKLFTVSKKECFYRIPLLIQNNELYWQAYDSFVGDSKRIFRLEIYKNNEFIYHGELSLNDNESIKLNDGIYKYKISSLDNNMFKKSYITFFENEVIFGKIEKFIYHNKYIELTSATLSYIENDDIMNYWNDFIPKYFIDKIKYIEHESTYYYIGYLYTITKEGEKKYLNTLPNDKKIKEKINPVRLDFLTENTLSIIAGYNINDLNDFLGELIYDLGNHFICNINKSIKNRRYRIINSYRFREVKNV